VIDNLLLVMALVWATVIFVWVIFMLIAEYSAVAYVPPAVEPVIEILKKKVFWDLGSGESRIVKAVTHKSGCQAVKKIGEKFFLAMAKKRSRSYFLGIRSLKSEELPDSGGGSRGNEVLCL
jgi:hypothetical protein